MLCLSQLWDSLCIKVLIQDIVRRPLLAKWAVTAHFWVCVLTLEEPQFRWQDIQLNMVFQSLPGCHRHLRALGGGLRTRENVGNGESDLKSPAGTWSQSIATVGTKKACCGKFALQMNNWVWDIPIISSCMNISGQSLNFRATWGMVPGFHFVESLVM